jgi:hypothetical protein
MSTQTIVTTDATILVFVTESPVALAAVWMVEESGRNEGGRNRERNEEGKERKERGHGGEEKGNEGMEKKSQLSRRAGNSRGSKVEDPWSKSL